MTWFRKKLTRSMICSEKGFSNTLKFAGYVVLFGPFYQLYFPDQAWVLKDTFRITLGQLLETAGKMCMVPHFFMLKAWRSAKRRTNLHSSQPVWVKQLRSESVPTFWDDPGGLFRQKASKDGKGTVCFKCFKPEPWRVHTPALIDIRRIDPIKKTDFSS